MGILPGRGNRGGAPPGASAVGGFRLFVDIYALLREHRPLTALLELYRRKYDVEDVGHVVFGLGYFDDADEEGVTPTMLWDVGWDEVKRFVARAVRTLANREGSRSDPRPAVHRLEAAEHLVSPKGLHV